MRCSGVWHFWPIPFLLASGSYPNALTFELDRSEGPRSLALLFSTGMRRGECLNRGWSEVPVWIFCSEADPSNTERTWLRLRRRAHKDGIRPLKLHHTRHTWAAMALEAGRSVRWVADALGHADPALTFRVYTHAIRAEEADLSFADFGCAPAGEAGLADGSKRPFCEAAPRGRV